MKRRILVLSVGILGVTLLSGCSTKLGNFTAASTQNVRNLDYSIENKTKQNVKGESCIHQVLFVPVGHSDDRIQRAMDSAISVGQNKGLDGDLLVNVRINHRVWSVGLYGQDCIEVEGDLVALDK